METQNFAEILKIAWPLIVIQIALAVWAVTDILRKKKTRSLTPAAWIFIAIIVNTVGPILYFILGRVEE